VGRAINALHFQGVAIATLGLHNVVRRSCGAPQSPPFFTLADPVRGSESQGSIQPQGWPSRFTLEPTLATLPIMQSRDTTREASDVQRELHRRLGPVARVELAFAMSQKSREISIAAMMDRDPTLSYSEARDRLLARLLGEDLYRRATSSSAK
jgi:hypothetical protein